MTSAVKKYNILLKDNKCNSVSPDQEQNFALTSVINKLKDDNLKLAKNFKSVPPGNCKFNGNGKDKGSGQKQTGEKAQIGKIK